MRPRSPVAYPARLAGLIAVIQQEEVARARRERAAHDLDAQGRDSDVLRRALQGSRPVMGSLRLMRLHAITAQWRREP